MKGYITMDDKIKEIEDYLEGLRDDDNVLILNSYEESLLNDALKIIKGLKSALDKKFHADVDQYLKDRGWK
jgi:hypothetical protein